MTELLLDAAGRRRSPATMPGFHARSPPRNKGVRYLAEPPTVEEIVAVMRTAGDGVHGRRLRGLIAVCGARVSASRRHWGCRSRISTIAAGRCWSAAARGVDGAKSAWTNGGGTTCVRG